MTLAEALLQKLARWRPEGDRQALEVEHPESGWVVRIEANQVELLGGRFWDVSVRRLTAAPLADLRARAEQLASRVTGLLEPLCVVEVDTNAGVAQLRSDVPGHWGEGAFYYEALLHCNGAAAIRRYQAPSLDQPRRCQVAFTLTHEALAKLVTDLTQ